MPRTAVVTARSNFQDTVEAHTPDGVPDVIIQPLSVLNRLAVRTMKVYVSSVLGVLGYSVVSVVAPVPAPMEYHNFIGLLQNACLLSVGPTIINLLINLYILLNQLDESHPSLMG